MATATTGAVGVTGAAGASSAVGAAGAASARARRTRIRPTARGACLLVVAVLLWAGGEITGLAAGRLIGIALVLALLLSLVAVVLLRIGLGLSRRVLDDAVTAGAPARVDLRLLPTALAARVPLGSGTVTAQLPAGLGGPGDLRLAPRMPHHVQVGGRGIHELGPCLIRLRDPFGLLQLSARIELPGRIVGLPVVEPVDDAGTSRIGIGRRDLERAGAAIGSGELGVIPRPYAPGDDMRRIHWRASARAGRLMTREEEPPRSEGAVIVLDTRLPRDAEGDEVGAERRDPVQDRILDHAASLLVGLASHGWETRVVDADGDEITRMVGRAGGASPLDAEAGAIGVRAALIDLAGVGFGDAPQERGKPVALDHASGRVDLAIALGPDHGDPFGALELDRFAARAPQRTAIAVRPAAAGDERVRSAHDGTWLRLDAPADARLGDVLEAGS
ncbi:DUF58 domain-containing protein [Brachybacterium sp. ACRRE]|uniref:DUF58 domain-containing protein n=1 Tax=Brachybacterium sp. ACRRE TaxID=2918184 RepID=UPI001EF310CC|nr:DUF58 domain-containing protein [Brachybacterium sp. ACRRE]MCG7309801.1 DUF58 domain-containing protein [Brachybacterium sp. ACRRE]